MQNDKRRGPLKLSAEKEELYYRVTPLPRLPGETDESYEEKEHLHDIDIRSSLIMNQPLHSDYLDDPRYAEFFRRALGKDSYILQTSDEDPIQPFEHSDTHVMLEGANRENLNSANRMCADRANDSSMTGSPQSINIAKEIFMRIAKDYPQVMMDGNEGVNEDLLNKVKTYDPLF